MADPDTAHHYADQSDDVEIAVISGAGHLIHDERASRQPFLAAVSAYLDRVAVP